jgi:hypothetical protein
VGWGVPGQPLRYIMRPCLKKTKTEEKKRKKRKNTSNSRFIFLLFLRSAGH